MLDTGSQGLSKGDDIAIAEQVRNDEKGLSPRPLREQSCTSLRVLGMRVRGITLSRIAKIRSRSLSNSALSRGERKCVLFPLLGRGCHEVTGEGKVPSLYKGGSVRNDLSALVPFKKAAFTLAEVLITLGIIGVVAAMTMPTLIQNYQKQVTVNRLKKSYSLLSQAIRMAEIEHGPHSTWPLDWMYGNTFIETYLKDNVKFTRKTFVTDLLYRKGEYKNLKGEGIFNHIWTDQYIEATDGSIFIFLEGAPTLRDCINVVIDINGINKPNKVGKDVFYFKLCTDGKGVQPFAMNYPREKLLSGSSDACNKNSTGKFCSALILLDGWKISDDYPW